MKEKKVYRILAIDDDESILRLIKNSLERSEFEVTTRREVGNIDICSFIGFDLILLDPPYGKGLVDDILEFLIVNEMLNDECMIVVEELKEVEFKPFKELDLIKKNDYGITALNVFKFMAG